MEKEKRHTCVKCGRKRNESRMKIVGYCHTGLPQWACNWLPYSYRFMKNCFERYNSPG